LSEIHEYFLNDNEKLHNYMKNYITLGIFTRGKTT